MNPADGQLVGLLILAALIAALVYAKWIAPRIVLLVDENQQPVDVIDARELPILAESPLFLRTVADLPVAGEMAARFAAEVEQYVRDSA